MTKKNYEIIIHGRNLDKLKRAAKKLGNCSYISGDLTKEKNIIVFGLNYKDTKINAQEFLNELGNPYEKIIFDQEGIIAIEWGAYGVPESFLIKDEIIIKRYIGPLDKKQTEEIKSIIK